MRKVIILTILSTFLLGCGSTESKSIHTESESTDTIIISETVVPIEKYAVNGRYYTNGTVITSDGNEWFYTTDLISEREPYDNMPVFVVFSDNGTPKIKDDVIKGIVFDKETSIYDELETQIQTNENWTVIRNGNDIKITVNQ